jgi:DNA-binding CsgD family transcriptional regulator
MRLPAAALSLATDLGLGQPVEYVLRSCLLSVRLAEALRLPEPVRRQVYFVALLRWIGCTSHAHEVSFIFGDEIATRARFARTDLSDPMAVLSYSLRRAGLVHDLGCTSVPNSIWDKPAALGDAEWERVRLHAYYTERALARSPFLAHLGTIATSHHERLDGSGYHRGAGSAQLTLSARLLAASDVYQAMREARPHRPALTSVEATGALHRLAGAGQLDPDAVNAVLAAAGQPTGDTPSATHSAPGGLSRREVEVLRLVARGVSTRETARQLFISERTAAHHVQHIYDKIGVSSRGAAALFAIEHGLLPEKDSTT